MTDIAPTATIDKTAQIGNDVHVGPGCLIAPNVVIGNNCFFKANAIVCSGVTIGDNNRFYSNTVIGEDPQIIGSVDPDTQLIIGNDNTFRENVNISRGSPKGGGKTIIGNQNFFMIASHIGHDCLVEDHCVIGNNSLVAGHCKIERNAWLSACTAIQQFVTVGRFAFTAGQSGIYNDLPPFVRGAGYPAVPRGLNTIGLQRAGFNQSSIDALKQAFRKLFKRHNADTLAQIVEELSATDIQDPNVIYLIDHLKKSLQHHMGRYLELSR